MTNRQLYTDYKGLSQWYDEKYRDMGGGWYTPPAECNRHLDAIGVPRDSSKWLLDIGCGGGHFLEEAVRRVNCIGLEISPVAVVYTKDRLAKVQTKNFNLILNQQVENYRNAGFFDYICSIGSLEHVLWLEDALESIRNLLAPNGKFYFYLPNTKWIHVDQPNELLADEEWWRERLERHRLHVESVTPWGLDNIAYLGRHA